MELLSLSNKKQKDLQTLKTARDSINRVSDPMGYQRANVAYNTLLHGPKWLQAEKDRISKMHVNPLVDKYTSQYSTIKKKHDTRDEAHDLKVLRDEIVNSTNVLSRLSQFSPQTSQNESNILYDFIVVVLGIVLLFQIYGKIGKLFASPKTPLQQIMPLTS